MELIIDFYKSLDTLNLIIFWGIIIVIILLLVFSFILINKNKKLKNLVAKTIQNEEDLPIKNNKPEINKEEIAQEKREDSISEENNTIILPDIPEIPKENTSKTIETERKFIAEEHVMEYNNDDFILSNIEKTNNYQENKTSNEISHKMESKKEFEMPTKPYQRNVLREMSLSQTSPIGITRPINKEDKKLEIAKDLEDSLNEKQEEKSKEITREKIMNENEIIKKDLTNIENPSSRKTEIMTENTFKSRITPEERNAKIEETKITHEKTYNRNNVEFKNDSLINRNTQQNEEKTRIGTPTRTNYEEPTKEIDEIKTNKITSVNQEYISEPVRELLNSAPSIKKESTIKSSSEQYLEEVSRKLAEAEIPDEIERTDYELEQEENAIISYKELMEKKDSIQTIDEEEAIISIEELMNKQNNKPEKEEIKADAKLYNLTEEEENDNFLKELKQFRNDL